jgi:hypothetical protein
VTTATDTRLGDVSDHADLASSLRGILGDALVGVYAACPGEGYASG